MVAHPLHLDVSAVDEQALVGVEGELADPDGGLVVVVAVVCVCVCA